MAIATQAEKHCSEVRRRYCPHPLYGWFSIVSILLGLSLGLDCRLSYGEAPLEPIAKITGTFVQYQSWMMQLDTVKWNSELNAMKEAGIDTIVIQWIKADHTRFFPVHTAGNDPTEIILTYADQNHMKIYLGLQFDRNWWNSWDDPDFLSKVVKKNLVFDKTISQRYAQHPSFAGWYIPYEMGDTDFDEDEIGNFRKFFADLSSSLKKLTKKPYPVALSTFFEAKIPASAVQTIYTEILRGSGIDILMVQDGVGAHDWTFHIQDKIAPYLNAYRQAAIANGIHLWNVVENFNTSKEPSGSGNARIPTGILRLKDQLLVQANQPNEKVLTFDFFHYMSPLRGEAQKRLYEDYIHQLKSQ